MISLDQALDFTRILIAVAVIFQGIELLQIRHSLSEKGIWKWTTLRKDFESFARPLPLIWEKLLAYSSIVKIIALQIIAAVLVIFFPSPLIFFILFMSSLLISVRFRGTFNGGADSMTLLILAALLAASFNALSKRWVEASLLYIAVQSGLSYFLAGLGKIKHQEWRNGKFLQAFLNLPQYSVPITAKNFLQGQKLSGFLSWAILLFECSFPLAFLNPQSCLAYLSFGLVFHLANFYLLGLNRFFWAWIASYPAIFYWSH